jgi:hypothetical protein
MRILAIDPGEKAGWAWITDGKYIRSGVIDGDSAPDCESFIRLSIRPDLLVCEDQYFGRMRGKGLFTLLRRRHIWEIFAQLYGIPFEAVNPSTWQSYWHIPKKGKKYIGTTTSHRKDAIIMVAEQFKRNVQPDEADAILIGLWAARKREGK